MNLSSQQRDFQAPGIHVTWPNEPFGYDGNTMRVIAGEFRSRRLLSLPGLETRPTPDRIRETLYNILGAEIEGAIFVDAYAGTGAVGIEAISRGARNVVFIEKSRGAVDVIRENLASLKATYRGRVIQGAAPIYLAQVDADIVFLDPPYDKAREYTASFDALEVKQPKLLIVQHSVRFVTPDSCGALKKARFLKQGDNALTFYRPDIT